MSLMVQLQLSYIPHVDIFLQGLSSFSTKQCEHELGEGVCPCVCVFLCGEEDEKDRVNHTEKYKRYDTRDRELSQKGNGRRGRER